MTLPPAFGRFVTRAALFAAALLLGGCQRAREPSPLREPPLERERRAPQIYAGDDLTRLDEGEPVDGGVLRVAMNAEPPSLNSQLDPLDGWSKKIGGLVLDSMARPSDRTWKHESHLAERWEVSPDKVTITFFLRQNVRWHDGKPFSADDVVFTFERLMDDHSKTSSIRSYLEPICRIEKVDSYIVRFTLREPYWFAFDAIAEIYIYPRHIYAKGDFNTHPANRAPVGAGPYRFVSWKTGDEIVLARNPTYFGEKPHLERIVFKYVPDPTARGQMLQRGDLDFIETVTPEEWRSLAQEAKVGERFFRLRHAPSGLQWLGWNEARPFFQDRRVRRALTMLLDRHDIVDNLRLGLDLPVVSWFYPGTAEYDAEMAPWPYDPHAAGELLDQAGWKDHDGDGVRDQNGTAFSFTFLYPAGPPFYEQLASLMQNDFRKAGITVNTARVEWAVYMERLRRHEFDACALLWQMTPRTDPYQVWHSSEVNGGSNFISFRNQEVDQLLEQARREFDDEKRTVLYRRFNQILHEEEPYTMLYERHHLSILSKRFGGIVSTPYGVLSYTALYLRRSDEQAKATR